MEKRKVPAVRFKGFEDDWEQRKLSELAEKTFGGGTPATSNEAYWNGDIPWIQSSDVVGGKLFGVEPRKWITRNGLNNSAAQLIPENSIAIITRVGVGKLAFMPYSYATSQDFLSLSKLNTEPLFTVYDCYKKLQSELNAVQGTSIKGITKDELLAKDIMVPKYTEQQPIGAFFSRLDNLITLHQRKLEKLQLVKKSMLEKMFPKNGSKIPEIRFKGFTDDWEQRKVSDVVTEVSRPIELKDNQRYQLVTVKRRNEGVVSRGSLYGRDILVKNYFEIHAGDYLISKRQLVHGANGIVPEDLDNAVVSNEYMACISNEYILADFLALLSRTKSLKQDFFLSSYGVDIEKLVFDVNDWKKRYLVLPQKKEQKQICEFFRNLDNLITLHQRKLEKMKSIKKSLLEKLFVQ